MCRAVQELFKFDVVVPVLQVEESPFSARQFQLPVTVALRSGSSLDERHQVANRLHLADFRSRKLDFKRLLNGE